MQLSSRFTTRNADRFRFVKAPGVDTPPAQRDPAVIETVSRMLSEIERGGLDAIARYAKELDRQDAPVELTSAQIAASGDRLAPDLREAIELGSARTKQFAAMQREHLTTSPASSPPEATSLATSTELSPITRSRTAGCAAWKRVRSSSSA